MRPLIVRRLCMTAGGLLAAALLAAPVHAAASTSQAERDLCKKVRAALADGRTMDQIVSEFSTDAEHVTKCLQQRPRRRKPSARARTKKKKKQKAAETKREASQSGAEGKSTAEEHRPRLHPSHPVGTRVVP